MSISYRTRRKLNVLGMAVLVFAVIAAVTWLCWVIWLQRYVVYEDESVRLDFSRSANDILGEVAKEEGPAEHKISIYYNEGADAITTTKTMEALNGYYITYDMCKQDMQNLMLQVERLPAGTPVMLELKLPYGYFLYSSQLDNAVFGSNTNLEAMDALIEKMKSKGFYTIAWISTFQDWNFVNAFPAAGLKMASQRSYCWLDDEGYFVMDPSSATTQTWLSSIIMELRDLGFNEVVLGDYHFPVSDKYHFSGDKEAVLQETVTKLIAACGSNEFVLSFHVTSSAFPLPEGGRSRIYVEGVAATQLASQASQATVDDVGTKLVFLTENGDTRYDDYSVLRSIQVSDEVEARKR